MVRIERGALAVRVGGFISIVSLTMAFGCSSPVPNEAIEASSAALTAPAWAPGTAYAVGNLVSYGGKVYRVIQAHTAQTGWNPEDTAALYAFEAIDSGSNSPATPTSPPGALDLDYVTTVANCNDSPESCCALGSTFTPLTEGADVHYSTQPNRCISAAQGNDTIYLQSSGPSSLLLGVGDDTAMDGAGDDLIWGGYGRDTINGYGGTNLFFGGHGDDVILAANGTNTVVPGPGRDTVATGTGNDKIYVFDLCEVAWGETIDGGTGTDTLYSPVPLSELQALGVTVSNIESVVVEPNSCRSECVTKPNCSGHGRCVEGGLPGTTACQCDEGYGGPSCSPLDTANLVRKLPKPPRHRGCYRGTKNGWTPIPCSATPADNEPYGIPEVTTEISIGSISDPAQTPNVVPFQFGQVETTLSSFGSVADVEGTSLPIPNTLSVQLNTNTFKSPSGHDSVIQFVLQTSQIYGNELCVWSIDKTLACSVTDANGGCINYAGYGHECVGGAGNWPIGSREGGFKQFDFATVAGSTFIDDSGAPAVGMVIQFSWFESSQDFDEGRGLYSIVVPDSLGLSQGWTEASGSMFGMGSSSRADFTDSSVLTRILAGSCVAQPGPATDIPWPGSCNSGVELLPRTFVHDVDITAETTNLLPVGSPTTLAAITSELVYTQFLQSTSGSCIPGTTRAFVRDSASDVGVVPSNAGNEPFWESPDIFVVPVGTPVSVDGIASTALLAPGATYDVYVRVNNDYGCSDVTGAKARVYLADPAALSTAWQTVTPGGFAGNVVVPAGGRALIGPLTFTAPTSGLGDGHKCLLAAIAADGQPAPTVEFDAPGSYQVAQRNLQFGECVYPITNGTGFAGTGEISLSATGATPSLSGGNVIAMSFEDPGSILFNTWTAGAGTTYAVSRDGSATVVRLGRPAVNLPPISLFPGQTILARGAMTLQQGTPTTTLSMGTTFTGIGGSSLIQNGASCRMTAPVIR